MSASEGVLLDVFPPYGLPIGEGMHDTSADYRRYVFTQRLAPRFCCACLTNKIPLPTLKNGWVMLDWKRPQYIWMFQVMKNEIWQNAYDEAR